jgi:8-oxo-dGTP diphosphatase
MEAKRKLMLLQGLFPGGKIEEGEDPKEALHRELEEELCIDAEIGEHLCNTTYDTRKLAVHLQVFHVTKFYGNMVLSVHDSAKWVKPKDLQKHKLLKADIPVADFIVQMM